MHSKAKHPVQYHAKEFDDLKSRPEVKRRCSEDEVTKMAKEEAKILLRHGDAVNMNQELAKIIPGRSLEAIKGKRRPQSYKKMVLDILNSLTEF